ncbi:MAG: chitobiase/beta-hexosaminidase C-terminal domain-containing protein, partial [Eubacteriaceae bacterium]|nr:chitobiase/beta-hexosaminidase C-terminal domain-containing protein [Eubacteriaceae bacterium]
MKKRKRISLLSSSLILISLVLLLLLTGCKMNADKINQPSYSVNEGTYTAPITVEINKPDGTDILIYYTIDGTDPTVTATKYTGPIVIATTDTLKSIAVDKNGSSSEIKSAIYTISIPIPIENKPGITNNDNEKFMGTIEGTWVASQEGWTLTYAFTPIDSTRGTLVYLALGP